MQPVTTEKTFHLRWNNHLQNLSQLFTTIYSSAALADVTLSCRDGTIKAHKLVLSACSPYFEQIFKENPCKHPVIILKGIPYSEINLLVEFMYKGSVDVQEMDLQSLMHTASELEIRGLAYEVRKDASQLLNVNLEYPSFSTASSGQYAANSSNYEATPRTTNQYQTDMERLRQIHLYQQSMCRNTPYSQVPQQNSTSISQTNADALKKKRKDEMIPNTTSSAVKNILAAAAKEMAETQNGDPNDNLSTCIQTEEDYNDTKDELDSTDTDERSETSQQVQDDEEPLHNRDTRFKGKKRVSVGLRDDYDTQPDTSNKVAKKKVRFGSKSPRHSDDGSSAPNAGEYSNRRPGTPNVDSSTPINPQKSIIKVVNISHLQQKNDELKQISGSILGSSYTAEKPSYISDNDDYESDVSYKGVEGASEIDKMHKCDMCDARFCYVTVLEKHRMKHRMQQCGGCGMTFVDVDKYKKHMRICERDDPTVRDPDEARRKDLINLPQNSMIPGMVSIGHSERSTLMFTPSGDVMLAPRSDVNVSMNVSQASEMSQNMSSGMSMNLSSDRSMMEEGVMRIDGVDVPIKRGRGRPRKTPLSLVPKIKRKRGRPPKYWSSDGMHPGPKENYNAANLPFGDFGYLTEMMYGNQPTITEGYHHSMQNMEANQSMNMHRNNYIQQRNPGHNASAVQGAPEGMKPVEKQYSNQARAVPINYSTGVNSGAESLVELKPSDEARAQPPAPDGERPPQPQQTLTVGDCQVITTHSPEVENRPRETPPLAQAEADKNGVTLTKIGDCTIERVTENT